MCTTPEQIEEVIHRVLTEEDRNSETILSKAIRQQVDIMYARAFKWLVASFFFIVSGCVMAAGMWLTLVNQVDNVKSQTERNSIAIETSVLTVKDKDNLDLKINNLSSKIDANNEAVLGAIKELRAQFR